MFNILLKGPHIEAKDEDQITTLRYVSELVQTDIVKYIYPFFNAVNQKQIKDRTPYDIACDFRYSDKPPTEIIPKLLK